MLLLILLLLHFQDTFVHVTDLSGRETVIRVTGGMKAVWRRGVDVDVVVDDDVDVVVIGVVVAATEQT